MKKLKTYIARMKKNNRLMNNKGQGMVEYILLLVVIVAIATAFKGPITAAVGDKISTLKESITNFSGN